MARKNTGLKTPIPNKATFIYGSTGARDADRTRIEKGGDLRARKSKNNGK